MLVGLFYERPGASRCLLLFCFEAGDEFAFKILVHCIILSEI